MSRKRKSIEAEAVDINEIRGKIREEINNRYGSVPEFLDSEAGKKFGGRKIRPYLYDTGAINFNVISDLCKYLGIGTLTRKIVVTRSYNYSFVPNIPPNEKTS